MSPADPASSRRLLAFGLVGYTVLAQQLTLVEPLALALHGGESHQHGDWLVNLAAGPVRRGPLGEALLTLADATGLHPLLILTLLQLALMGVVVVGVCVAFVRAILGAPDLGAARARAAMMLLPAFVLPFWAADRGSLFRKELFALAAMSLALAVPGSRRSAALPATAAAALLLVGMAGHEINVLLLPATLAVWHVALSGRPDALAPSLRRGLVGGLLAGAAAASLYALRYHAVDPEPVCRALTDRGLDDVLCEGSIAWLGKGGSDTRAFLAARFASASGPAFLIASCVACAQAAWVLGRQGRPGVGAAAAGFAIPLLPLFVVAVDWGRWLALGTTCLVLWVLASVLASPTVPRPLPAWAFALLFVTHAFWGLKHTVGVIWGGAVVAAFDDLRGEGQNFTTTGRR